MRIILITLTTFLLFSGIQLGAQDYKIKPGHFQANFGVGLVPTYAADVTQTIVPPVSAGVDVFLSSNFSLGLYGAFSKYSGENVYSNAGISEKFETSTWMLGLRTGIHSNDLDGWRVYGGFILGATIPDIEKETTVLSGEVIREENLPSFSRPGKNGLLFSGYVGTRRCLKEHVSVFGELGFGISLATVGVSYKF